MDKRLGIKFKANLITPLSQTTKAFLNNTKPFTVAEGPRNTSKTLHSLWWLFSMHDRTPGLQTMVIRTKQNSIRRTIVDQLNNKLLKYPVEDKKRNPFRYYGGTHPDRINFKNKGSMQFGGMDNSDKVLGAELHIAFYSQIELEENPHNISNLLGAMAGYRAGKLLRDRNGNPYYRVMGDSNPGSPFHFLYEWEKHGKVEFYDFKHKDHPQLWDDEKDDYNELGIQTIQGLLDAYPPGYMRDRMVFGKRAGAQGRVYPMFDPKVHEIEIRRDDIPAHARWYFSCDWGGINAVGLYAEFDRKHSLFKEIYRDGESVQQIIGRMKALQQKYRVDHITDCYVDHEIDNRKQMEAAGYRYTLPYKQNKAGGIEDVKYALSNGLIYFNKHSLDEPDTQLLGQPHRLSHEMMSLAYKPADRKTGAKSDDLPDPRLADHACDHLQYYVVERVERPQIGYPPVMKPVSKIQSGELTFGV